ncbi:class I SAM-dependent methyltransferase [Bradyrhizobium diazoefficiens]|nr:class I SAM-dependent methyltransferase [Bradyrhizobium diazoefficiens]MBR0774591.1 class I SAM-dependent methyltransferase [Bradyrhizobium diazoefficiens]
MDKHQCRSCGHLLSETFVDLARSPLANSFVHPDHAEAVDRDYPLHVYVCGQCRLVQLPQIEPVRTFFDEYLYYSSYSESWLRHSEAYVRRMIACLGLTAQSEVIEIASNDGYLLQYFKRAGIPMLGIEPAAGPASVAVGKGIPTRIRYFGRDTAAALRAEGHRPDLIVANNVVPHVPDVNDFVAGLRVLLPEGGHITLELPYLLRLIEQTQFDTIYHEHLSYFSLASIERVLGAHDLMLVDAEELPTHGGSLRLHVRGREVMAATSPTLQAMRQREAQAGLGDFATYRDFAARVAATRAALLDFLGEARRAGKTVLGYGAPAKGNTLLNYCGVTRELLPFTVDRNPHKQGMLLPGTRLPIRDPAALIEAKPDYVLILPWNLKDEIITQMVVVRSWGGQFVVPIPRLQVIG